VELGEVPEPKPLIVSEVTAKRLGLDTGQHVVLSIFDADGRDRSRKFEVCGIYNTGLEEFDELFSITDIGVIQQINAWDSNQVGGFELFLEKQQLFKSRSSSYFLIAFGWLLNDKAYFEMNRDPIQDRAREIKASLAYLPHLSTTSVRDINPNIFEWLELQTTNEFLILLIMIGVAVINMMTTLLILILERTHMTGVLKALGARDFSIQKVFLNIGVFIIGLGMLIGNALSLLLIFLQQKFAFITLPEESYYVSVAPVDLDLAWWLAINLGTLVVCFLILTIPSYLVRRISPIRAIRLD
jgi:lipoprotein-releasing system permease protein